MPLPQDSVTEKFQLARTELVAGANVRVPNAAKAARSAVRSAEGCSDSVHTTVGLLEESTVATSVVVHGESL